MACHVLTGELSFEPWPLVLPLCHAELDQIVWSHMHCILRGPLSQHEEHMLQHVMVCDKAVI